MHYYNIKWPKNPYENDPFEANLDDKLLTYESKSGFKVISKKWKELPPQLRWMTNIIKILNKIFNPASGILNVTKGFIHEVKKYHELNGKDLRKSDFPYFVRMFEAFKKQVIQKHNNHENLFKSAIDTEKLDQELDSLRAKLFDDIEKLFDDIEDAPDLKSLVKNSLLNGQKIDLTRENLGRVLIYSLKNQLDWVQKSCHDKLKNIKSEVSRKDDEGKLDFLKYSCNIYAQAMSHVKVLNDSNSKSLQDFFETALGDRYFFDDDFYGWLLEDDDRMHDFINSVQLLGPNLSEFMLGKLNRLFYEGYIREIESPGEPSRACRMDNLKEIEPILDYAIKMRLSGAAETIFSRVLFLMGIVSGKSPKDPYANLTRGLPGGYVIRSGEEELFLTSIYNQCLEIVRKHAYSMHEMIPEDELYQLLKALFDESPYSIERRQTLFEHIFGKYTARALRDSYPIERHQRHRRPGAGSTGIIHFSIRRFGNEKLPKLCSTTKHEPWYRLSQQKIETAKEIFELYFDAIKMCDHLHLDGLKKSVFCTAISDKVFSELALPYKLELIDLIPDSDKTDREARLNFLKDILNVEGNQKSHSSVNYLFNNPDSYDVRLNLKSQRVLYLHQEILKQNSYFQALFEFFNSDPNQNKIDWTKEPEEAAFENVIDGTHEEEEAAFENVIDGTHEEEEAAFVALIKSLYTNELEVSGENFLAILALADQYQFSKPFVICHQIMWMYDLCSEITASQDMQIDIDIESWRLLLHVIKEFRQNNLLNDLYEFLHVNFNNYQKLTEDNQCSNNEEKERIEKKFNDIQILLEELKKARETECQAKIICYELYP